MSSRMHRAASPPIPWVVKAIYGVLLSLLLPIFTVVTATAKAIPVDLELSVLDDTPTTIDETQTYLVKWRTGTPNQAPIRATELSFQYFQSGTDLELPTRGNPFDNSANDQNDLWSDNGIQIGYVKGRQTNQRILIYTDDAGGGLKDNASDAVIPLIWKPLPPEELAKVSDAGPGHPIPSTSLLYMPTEILDNAGGQCPKEGPWLASLRAPNQTTGKGGPGFCDYSTRYMIGKGPLFYDNFPAGSDERRNRFRYSSVVGSSGVVIDEADQVNARWNPVVAVIGANFFNARPGQYSTSIQVELRSL